MKITIQTQEPNTLLNRTNVVGTISFDGATPSKQDVTGAVAKKMGAAEELVVMGSITNIFSTQEAHFTAAVYTSAEARTKADRMTSYRRKQQEEAQKKAAEQAKAAAGEQ
ncbi:MAG: 30S ribosomal protein S24e [Nanoarchaeota archaeon]|nr:30S ribosomal protein S24e [Nanoarchaeota archaeon]